MDDTELDSRSEMEALDAVAERALRAYENDPQVRENVAQRAEEMLEKFRGIRTPERKRRNNI